VEVERSLPRFSGDACAARLAELLRRFLRLRAEMAHFNINLQYYINLEVLECEWQYGMFLYFVLLCFTGPVCVAQHEFLERLVPLQHPAAPPNLGVLNVSSAVWHVSALCFAGVGCVKQQDFLEWD
jgi:hypothetical protein